MRTLKLIAAVLLISAATAVHAQTDQDAAKTCADMTKAQTEMLTKELALDKDQAAKVNELLMENAKSKMAMSGHDEKMDTKAMKQDEATYASIKEVLKDDQQAKFDKLKASGKLDSCGKEGGKGCCAGKQGAKAQKEGNFKSAQPATKVAE